jgi:CheY-like chemotaxis protein
MNLEASSQSGTQRRPLRALVSYDDETGARLLLTLLRQEGMTVTVARNGAELLSLLQVAQPAAERRYDLVLCGAAASNRRDVDLLAEVLDLCAPTPVVFLPRRSDLPTRSAAERLGTRWVVPRVRMLDDVQEIARFLQFTRTAHPVSSAPDALRQHG